MLRGAIEYADLSRVSGWVYSEAIDIRGSTILALLDDACVGSGTVGLFRKDLADAGLSHGSLGFDFPITVPTSMAARRIVVKLERSDAIFIQASSRIWTFEDSEGSQATLDRLAPHFEWMRERGWLEQTNVDLLRALYRIGAYDLSLRRRRDVEDPAGPGLIKPEGAAEDALSLLSFSAVQVHEEVFRSGMDLTATKHVLGKALREPIVALWSAKPGRVLVAEGSHRDFNVDLTLDLEGAVEYLFGPSRLLLLDTRCNFLVQTPTDTEITVFSLRNAGP